ncbi:3-phenylpropionate MFS transporter [Endozoicomonas sp. OPT23]|uniref:3-phenylpropionate MFS transporter n=1 Tax=Endozoicomonas sp. OPT23 TaxID=2072845 RepID=UPI00129AEF5C|nr:3-phenylpropionate MFS transporter [Endozoicomonas sp. OPT23]MRI33555.1 3-phenylpropionate MFS transporter [Endozoicomonas sp. OPT23]
MIESFPLTHNILHSSCSTFKGLALQRLLFKDTTPFRWVSFYFFGFFFIYSYFLPFWSLWLQSRGVGSEDIGLILGLGMGIRCLANLLVASKLKNLEHLLFMLRTLILGMLLSCVLLVFSGSNLWLLGGLTLLFSALMAPSISLSDVMAIRYASDGQVDYGKSRRWGSIGFMIGTAVSGFIIEGYSEEAVLWVIILGLAAMFFYACKRPVPGVVISKELEKQGTPSLWQLLKHRDILFYLLLASLIQGSHGALYSFGSLYWKSQQVSESFIGILWSVGVVAEIIVFTLASRFVPRFSIKALFQIAAVGVVLRWSLVAVTTEPVLLVSAQILHAITFGICHLGMTRFIQSKPQQMSIPLQGLYNAIPTSAAIALTTFATGYMFESLQGNIFWIMAGLGLLALMLSVLYKASSSESSEFRVSNSEPVKE